MLFRGSERYGDFATAETPSGATRRLDARLALRFEVRFLPEVARDGGIIIQLVDLDNLSECDEAEKRETRQMQPK
jgi:hypothetical protein